MFFSGQLVHHSSATFFRHPTLFHHITVYTTISINLAIIPTVFTFPCLVFFNKFEDFAGVRRQRTIMTHSINCCDRTHMKGPFFRAEL